MTQIRINGLRRSHCCSWPTALVKSMDGGFVTSNCTRCGQKKYLSNTEFFYLLRCDVDCPHCGDRMHKAYVWKNYGFECPSCQNCLRLADLLPWWFDVSPRKSPIVIPRIA